jgi:hypothetical protein
VQAHLCARGHSARATCKPVLDLSVVHRPSGHSLE